MADDRDAELARLALENAQLRTRLRELEDAAPRASNAALLESVLRAVPVYIAELDPELRIRYVNRYQPGSTPDAVLGRSIFDFQPPDMHPRLRNAVAEARSTGRVVPLASKAVGANGDSYDYIAYVAPIRHGEGVTGYCLAAVDVTEATARERRLRETEAKLRQAQKMEVVGTLTAGVAHNFNNMLTVILPTLELAARVVPPERAGLLREAQHAARRAADMVQQLMTYAGHSPTHARASIDVRELVDASLAICKRAIDPTIAVSVRYEDAPHTLRCNAVQVEQVLVNLLLNARDAVLEAKCTPGRIDVVIEQRAGALAGAEPHEPARDAVCMSVIDNGTGMRDDVREKVFEPFFTTKAPGRGTGLGLATSYAIARDHEGTLACEPAAGSGTRFTLILPLTRDESSSHTL